MMSTERDRSGDSHIGVLDTQKEHVRQPGKGSSLIQDLLGVMLGATGTQCRYTQVKPPDASRVKRFIPFSEGRRDCVGQHLARMNYTSTLARLLGNLHFEIAPEVRTSVAFVCSSHANHACYCWACS